ncbi:MAG: hypothetical protein HYX77_08795 [Acidobacteria bacterium]|nr:hypothetical protein [Acidobacteriota bacterium]
MKCRLVLLGASTAVLAVIASVPLAGQAPAAASNDAASTYTPPRTPWGAPDLEGHWRSRGNPSFERRAGETREFFTDEEIRKREENAERQNELRRQGKQENRGFRNQPNYNSVLGYSPEKQKFSKRTSAIIDPPDGHVPGWTLEQVKYYEYREAVTLGRGDSDWTVDRPVSERCFGLLAQPVMANWGMAQRGAPRAFAFTASEGTVDGGASGGGGGAGPGGPYRLVQTQDYITIVDPESGIGGGMAGSRIIPLDGRPALSKKFRSWMGVSRGHWEGNTLVVVTTNVQYPGPVITSYGGNYPGTGETLTLTERFTRTGPDKMEYRYTVDDPGVYVRPYTALYEMTLDDSYKISYILCHEGHDDMPSALQSGRNDEANATENANDTRILRAPRLKEIKEEAIKAAEAMKTR